jgi:hypothetical protein
MSTTSSLLSRHSFLVGVSIAVVLAVLAGRAISAQDKYSLEVPNGLPFSDIRGYEDWTTVSVSQTEIEGGEAHNILRAILANPVMIQAYRAGIPGNGKPFPDGSKIVKLVWSQKKITNWPPFSKSTPDTVVDNLKLVEFIKKDTKRFPDAHGWGYGEFAYDVTSDTFKPAVTGAKCGASCHEAAAKTDYIFNAYAKR